MSEFEVMYRVSEKVVAAAREVQQFIVESGGKDSGAASLMILATYALQQKAREFRWPTAELGMQKLRVSDEELTCCPSCQEYAPHYMQINISPPLYAYRCSRGHTWRHEDLAYNDVPES